jgi:hypothetical protein
MPADGSSSPRSLSNNVRFPRGLIATNSSLWVSGFIDNTAYALDYTSGSILKTYGPATQVLAMGEMCSIGFDEVSGTVYGGIQSQPYSQTNAGVWRLDFAKGGLEPWAPLQSQKEVLGMCGMAIIPDVVPMISAVSTKSVSRVGGTEVLIQADNLVGNALATCLFGGVISVGAEYVLPNTVKCVAPASPVVGTSTVQLSNYNYGADYSDPVQILYV